MESNWGLALWQASTDHWWMCSFNLARNLGLKGSERGTEAWQDVSKESPGENTEDVALAFCSYHYHGWPPPQQQLWGWLELRKQAACAVDDSHRGATAKPFGHRRSGVSEVWCWEVHTVRLLLWFYCNCALVITIWNKVYSLSLLLLLLLLQEPIVNFREILDILEKLFEREFGHCKDTQLLECLNWDQGINK